MSSPFLFVKTAVVKISISTRKEGGVVHSSCAYADVAGILICLSGVCAYAYVLMKTTLDGKVFLIPSERNGVFCLQSRTTVPVQRLETGKVTKLWNFRCSVPNGKRGVGTLSIQLKCSVQWSKCADKMEIFRIKRRFSGPNERLSTGWNRITFPFAKKFPFLLALSCKFFYLPIRFKFATNGKIFSFTLESKVMTEDYNKIFFVLNSCM